MKIEFEGEEAEAVINKMQEYPVLVDANKKLAECIAELKSEKAVLRELATFATQIKFDDKVAVSYKSDEEVLQFEELIRTLHSEG